MEENRDRKSEGEGEGEGERERERDDHIEAEKFRIGPAGIIPV